MIPRVFHQIWLGPDPFPSAFARYQDSWLRHHPDWTLRFWTDDNPPEGVPWPEVMDAERSPAERSDLLRLFLLERFGGVYVDTDMECLRPIDDLLEGVEVFAGELKPGGRLNNAILGAVQGHPVLRRAVATARVQGDPDGGRFDKTASGSLFVDALLSTANEVTVFPAAYFHPEADELDGAYAQHHMARSWKDEVGWAEAARVAERRLAQERKEHERTRKELDRLRRQVAELEDDASAAGDGDSGLRVTVFLLGAQYGRVMGNLLGELLDRGHSIEIVLPAEAGKAKRSPRFSQLAAHPRCRVRVADLRNDTWARTTRTLRAALDYLRYLEPSYEGAAPLRARAESRAPATVRAAVRVGGGRASVRAGMRSVLTRLERAVPPAPGPTALLEKSRPDVVLATPVVSIGSLEADNLRAARQLGIPTVLPVASWDNLTNKGLIHETPTATIVWNEHQVREAVELHGLPPRSLHAVGAHSFDHWISWKPERERTEFLEAAGLDPRRQLVAYVGSSGFISGDEVVWVREWLTRLLADPRFDDVAVLLRPHPYNAAGWDAIESVAGRVVVLPKAGEVPEEPEAESFYAHTLHHADAVVGLSTSAQVEAAIFERPVLTVVDGRRGTQEGTLHFAHIAGDDGMVVVARSTDEHLDQLAEVLADPDAAAERGRRFVTDFVRGPAADRAPASLAADVVEATAARRVRPIEDGRLRRAYRRVPSLANLLLFLLDPGSSAPRAKALGPKQRKAVSKGIRRRRTRLANQRRRAGKRARKGVRRVRRVVARQRKLTRRRLVGLLNTRYRRTYTTSLASIPSRDELPIMLNRRGLLGTAVEIGVKRGVYSEHLLRRWQGERLVSVDPWLSVDWEEYVDRSNVSQPEFDENYEITKQRLAEFGSRSDIWRLTSVEAAEKVPDRSLDFVFIDARHDYDSVKEDLEAWFPKVRPGGVIAGHDYADGHLPQGDFGVRSAVDEFFAAASLVVHSTDGPSAVETFPSWIVEVPQDRAR